MSSKYFSHTDSLFPITQLLAEMALAGLASGVVAVLVGIPALRLRGIYLASGARLSPFMRMSWQPTQWLGIAHVPERRRMLARQTVLGNLQLGAYTFSASHA